MIISLNVKDNLERARSKLYFIKFQKMLQIFCFPADSVILESPVRPVKEGNNVTLSCRNKTTSSNLTAEFYKDGVHIGSTFTGKMIIHSVSKSDEGWYKCKTVGGGESPESWMAVRGKI